MAYDNPQNIMADIQAQNLNNMRNLIIRANNNPRSLSEDELALAIQYGQQLGVDMSPSMKRNKANMIENVGAGIGGAIDASLFGIIPDNWYSSYRTKTAKNVGKLTGTVGSFFIPGYGILNATKGAKGIAKTATALFGTGQRLAKVGTKLAGKGYVEAGKIMGNQLLKSGTSAFMKSFEGMSKAQIAKEMAKILIRTNQTMGSGTNVLYPSNDTSQLNPYTQSMGVNGMPQL